MQKHLHKFAEIWPKVACIIHVSSHYGRNELKPPPRQNCLSATEPTHLANLWKPLRLADTKGKGPRHCLIPMNAPVRTSIT
jgi:hypothetical protein